MHKQALDKASQRLRIVKQSLKGLQEAASFQDTTDQWYMFLHAAKGIYTTLEQGAKATPQARQWFGKKNQERRSDELLRYISEARNDDEHGIESVTKLEKGHSLFGVAEKGFSQHVQDANGNVFIDCGVAIRVHEDVEGLIVPKLKSLDKMPIKSEKIPPRAVLVTVKDRSKNIFNPPSVHLNRKIDGYDPLIVASLAFEYLARLLDEAEGFRTP